MNAKPRAGLLPLYLKLYDDTRPETRGTLEAFVGEIAAALARAGLEVEAAPVCRVAGEFARAVAGFDRARVDAIVTLHLAYSPSGESIDALARAAAPLVILDTTTDAAFGTDVDPSRIMFNHGIHGVQDMANMLRRRGTRFEIAAGHWRESDVIARCADLVRAARAAARLRHTRALRIGESFRGMGDFAVPAATLARALGIEVAQVAPAELAPYAARVGDDEVGAEVARDRAEFDVDCPDQTHRRSVRLGLGLRAMLAERGCGAFSMNFLAFESDAEPVSVVPFLEASKAMARGTGYAGEGDVLTAALVGALLASWERTTFTEIFCPDWRGGTLFLSHMGEINPAVAAGKAKLCEKPFPWTRARPPAVLACAPAPGEAALVNLAPGPDDTFSLIVAPVEVCGDATHPGMKQSVRGWVRPRVPVARFLEEYSRAGGTHHSALVSGDHLEALGAFARLAGVDLVRPG